MDAVSPSPSVGAAGRRPGTASAAVILLVLAAALCLGLPAAAGAHVPFLEPGRSSDAPAVAGDPFPGAVRLPDVTVSRAVYGTLATGESLDSYRLFVSAAAQTPVQLLVPKTSGYREFRPAFALVGPGLASQGTPPAWLAQRLQVAYGGSASRAGGTPGVVVVPDPGASPRSTFYEPFSFSTYFHGGETTVPLRPGRTYFLVVYDPAGQAGEYVLGIAEAEKFTPADWFRAIGAVVRIKLGLYGQGAFHPFAAAVMAALVAGVVALVVVLVRRRRLRGRARAGAR